MGFFEPFALERFFAKHEFSARYLLCSSDCESFPVGELLAMDPGPSSASSTYASAIPRRGAYLRCARR